MVQIGAYSNRANADSVAQRLGAEVVSSGNLHRVRLGPYATEAQAQAAITRARSLGYPGGVIQRTR